MSSEQLSTRILSEQARIRSDDKDRKGLRKKQLDISKLQEIFMIYHYLLMKLLQ